MGLRLEKFSARAAIESVSTGVKAVAQKRKIHVDLAISPEIREVTLDQQKSKQILHNLLSNAIKFTESGGWNCRAEPFRSRVNTGLALHFWSCFPKRFWTMSLDRSGTSRTRLETI